MSLNAQTLWSLVFQNLSICNYGSETGLAPILLVRRGFSVRLWSLKAGYLLSGKSRDKVVIIFVVQDIYNEITYKVRAEPLKV